MRYINTLVTAQRHHSQTTPGKSDLTADKSLFVLTSQNLDHFFDSYNQLNKLILGLICLFSNTTLQIHKFNQED